MTEKTTTETEVETFGTMLRRYRRAAGLSQETLAERASISTDAVAALERGRRTNPRPATVQLLADALDLGVDDRRIAIALATGDPLQPPKANAPGANPESSVSAPLTRPVLIGREHDEAAILHLVRRQHAGARLLTLTGPGGIGKTSLALRVAGTLRDDMLAPATFVDLSSVGRADAVLDAIAAALTIRVSATTSVRDAVLSALSRTRMVLVLDNLEQIPDVADLVRDILERCPEVTVLATSRVALRLRGEQQFRVPPLELPDRTNGSLAAFSASPAVRLFVARAQAAEPSFELTGNNSETVAEICRRLDGLPLAIELAAARIRVLQPTEMLARLDHVLPLLRGGARDLPDRQKTMRAAIDWSYDLLAPAERRQFAVLAVFSGGFSMNAIEAVSDATDRVDVIDTMSTLVDHSLVSRITIEGETRLTMLETIREYAAERLALDQNLDWVHDAHARFFMQMALRIEPDLRGPKQSTALAELRRERENLRVALQWLIANDHAIDAQRCATALWRFWHMDGTFAEGVQQLDAVLLLSDDSSDDGTQARAWALHAVAILLLFYADLQTSIRRSQEALVLMRALDDRRGILLCLNTLANATRNLGFNADSVPLYEEALEIARDLDDPRSVAVTLNNLGSALHGLGELEQAESMQENSLALRRELADTSGIAMVLTNLGNVALSRGDLVRAESASAESLALHRILNDGHGTALALEILARVRMHQGASDHALALFTEGLELSQEVGDTGLVATYLHRWAEVARDHGMPERAATLLAVALRLDEEVRAPESGTIEATYDALIADVRTAMDPQTFDVAWAIGRSLPVEDAIVTAMAII